MTIVSQIRGALHTMQGQLSGLDRLLAAAEDAEDYRSLKTNRKLAKLLLLVDEFGDKLTELGESLAEQLQDDVEPAEPSSPPFAAAPPS